MTMHIVMLGCGHAATMHARLLRRIAPDVRLSFASRDSRKAAELCAQFRGRRAFPSYGSAIYSPDVDVAFVTTPTRLHRELARQALDAGKDVIVEKPAFMTAAEAVEIQRAATQASRRVFVAENYYYKPIAVHLRRAITSGDLGDVRFVSINATKQQRMTGWRADAGMSGGGALFEGGVHWVSFASNLGLDLASASVHRAGDGEGPELSSLVVFNYANGATGTLMHSWELAAPLRGMRLSKVQGTRGAVTFESNGFAQWTTGRRRSVSLNVRDALGYRAMLADFLGALRSGRAPEFTLAHATRDIALLERWVAPYAPSDCPAASPRA